MPDDAELDPLLLDRFLAGDLPAADRLRVDRWLAARPDEAAFLQQAARASLEPASSVPTDASWRQLSARLSADATVDDLTRRREAHDERAATLPVPSRSLWPPSKRMALRGAAALAMLLGGGALWSTAMREDGGALEAPVGRDLAATLPDGSRITLAAGSRVRWSADFGARARELQLDGEAHFDVVHDRTRPFRVRTRAAVAEDIGTRFVVRAWPEMAAVEVAVDEGIVALRDTVASHAARGATLRAGDRGRLSADGRITVTPDAEAVTAWVRGQIVFENEPLAIALPAIGRRFDVDLRADPSLKGRRLSARLSTASLPEVLDALALALDVRVVTSGRTITLLPSSR